MAGGIGGLEKLDVRLQYWQWLAFAQWQLGAPIENEQARGRAGEGQTSRGPWLDRAPWQGAAIHWAADVGLERWMGATIPLKMWMFLRDKQFNLERHARHANPTGLMEYNNEGKEIRRQWLQFN